MTKQIPKSFKQAILAEKIKINSDVKLANLFKYINRKTKIKCIQTNEDMCKFLQSFRCEFPVLYIQEVYSNIQGVHCQESDLALSCSCIRLSGLI